MRIDSDLSARKRSSLRRCLPAWVFLSLAVLLACPGFSNSARAGVVRIMPLGDSMISSIEGQVSFRYRLARRLANAGFQFDFVGSQWGVGSSSPPINFDANHEGHGGATTSDIANNVRDWASAVRPQIVLLLMGANDLDAGGTISPMTANLNYTISRLRSINPNMRILMGLQPPIPGLSSRIFYWNRAIQNVAAIRSTSRSPIYVVDFWTGWNPAQHTVDGTHPNAAGEMLMATRFYNRLVGVMAGFGQYPR